MDSRLRQTQSVETVIILKHDMTDNNESYFSSAAMIIGGSTRMGMGRTTRVTAVSKSACHRNKGSV